MSFSISDAVNVRTNGLSAQARLQKAGVKGRGQWFAVAKETWEYNANQAKREDADSAHCLPNHCALVVLS
jgi:hypothetical protein